MEEKSFYTFCISACIFMLFLNFSVIFVTALGVFPWTGDTDLPGGSDPMNVAGNVTGQSNAFLSIFTGNIGSLLSVGTILSLAGFAVVVGFAITSGNWNILAVYLFTVVFWGSWTYSLAIFNMGNIFAIPVMSILLTIISVGMFFLFVGAVTGLLHLGEG